MGGTGDAERAQCEAGGWRVWRAKCAVVGERFVRARAAKQMEGEQAMKYIADFLVRDLLKMPKKEARTVHVPEVKRKVLAYFARVEAVLFTTAPMVNVFSGEEINDANNGYSDGEYT